MEECEYSEVKILIPCKSKRQAELRAKKEQEMKKEKSRLADKLRRGKCNMIETICF